MIVTNKVDNNLLIENETFDADKDKEYYILNMNLQNNITFYNY